MEIAFLGSITKNFSGNFCLPYAAVNQDNAVLTTSDLEGATVVEGGVLYPHLLERFSDGARSLWIFGWFVIRTTPAAGIYEPITLEEKQLEIIDAVAQRAEYFTRLRASVKAIGHGERTRTREPIPDEVRVFVWRRDEGQCVLCGSRELLEFDHIIPVAKGGATTERNVQLLCEPCNRKKGTQICAD